MLRGDYTLNDGASIDFNPASGVGGSPFTWDSFNRITGRDARLTCNTQRFPAFSFNFSTTRTGAEIKSIC